MSFPVHASGIGSEVNIVFPASYVQVNIFSALLCILVPILFLWYYKKKTGVKIGAFFIGAAFFMLFSFILSYVLNILVISVFGLGNFLNTNTHPIYSSIYVSCSMGFITTLGVYVGLKYAMKQRPGKENALVFGVGVGGLESILNGTTIYVTNLISAVLINSIGSVEYFKKLELTGEELAKSQELFATQAATPASAFLLDASYLILSLVLSVSITVLIHRALDKHESYLFPVCAVLQCLGYVPMYLTQTKVLENSYLLFGIASVYIFVVAYFAYRAYTD